ncbi:MAG: PEGA domain-containing protein [Chloroflexota bacterium]
MNLLLFSVEVERSPVGKPPAERRPGEKSSVRPRRFGTLALAAAVIVCAVVAACGTWLMASGTDLADWFSSTIDTREQGSGHVAFDVASQPDHATVILDGHARGQTPITALVTPGEHTLVLRHPDAIDDQRIVSVASALQLQVRMWLRRPTAIQLRPAYPGANIADAAFLSDGHLALSMALPTQAGSTESTTLREPWLVDPTTGGVNPFAAAANVRAVVISVSPDGHSVAYLQQDQSAGLSGLTHQRLDSVWIAGAATAGAPVRLYGLPPVVPADAQASGEVESVRDVTWTPDGHHLLVAVRLLAVSGGYPAAARTRLLLLDTSDTSAAPSIPVELVVLPAEVVPRSYSWASDGHWVAFLSAASAGSGSGSFVALCAVDTSANGAVDGFRYVADLGRQTDPSSLLPIASVAWAPNSDARLVYVAATPRISTTNPLGLPGTSGGEPGLFMASPAGPALTAEEGRRLGSGAGFIAPAWRTAPDASNPSLIALARSPQANKPLVVRGIDPITGAVQNLGIELPAGVGCSAAVAARWDLAHVRVLILAHREGVSAGALDYWLVQLQGGQ